MWAVPRMADNWTLPKMSGRLNLPYQSFAFLEIVPGAPMTMGITATFVAPWTLLSSSARSWYLLSCKKKRWQLHIIVIIIIIIIIIVINSPWTWHGCRAWWRSIYFIRVMTVNWWDSTLDYTRDNLDARWFKSGLCHHVIYFLGQDRYKYTEDHHSDVCNL